MRAGKKHMIRNIFLLAAIICVGVMFQGNVLSVNAYYYGSVKNVKQVGAYKDQIVVRWDKRSDAAKYEIEIKEWEGDTVRKVGSTSATQYTIRNIKRGVGHTVNVYPVSATGERGFSGSLIGGYTIPNNVSGLKVEKYWYYSQSLLVRWNSEVGKRDGFELSVYDGRNKKLKQWNIISYADSDFINNLKTHAYTIKIRSYVNVDGKKYYSDYTTMYSLIQPRVKRCRVSSNKLRISWAKVTGATGYDVYVSTSKKRGYKKVKSVGKRTASVSISRFNRKKINKKRTYYVYVIPKKKVGKVTYKGIRGAYWNSKNSKRMFF